MIFEPLLEMERQVFSSFLQGTFSVSQVHYIIMIFNVYPPLLSSAIAQSNEYLKGSCLANLPQYQNDQLLKIRVSFHFDMHACMLAYASDHWSFVIEQSNSNCTIGISISLSSELLQPKKPFKYTCKVHFDCFSLENPNATFLLIFKCCELSSEWQSQLLIAHAKPKQTVLTLNPIRNTNNVKPEKMGVCSSLEHNDNN